MSTLYDFESFSVPKEPIQAVAFDMDGLMFNTEELYERVGSEILCERGCEMTEDLLQQMIGLRTPVALQKMIDYHGLTESVEELSEATQAKFMEILPTHLAPMPGLLELLDALEAAQIPKGVATSSLGSFARRVLGQFGFLDRIDFLLTAEDVIEGKPNPEIYLTAAQRFGVKLPAMLVLEDSTVGCKAAVAAGAFAVAVPGFHSFHNYPGVKFVANSLADERIRRCLRIDG